MWLIAIAAAALISSCSSGDPIQHEDAGTDPDSKEESGPDVVEVTAVPYVDAGQPCWVTNSCNVDPYPNWGDPRSKPDLY